MTPRLSLHSTQRSKHSTQRIKTKGGEQREERGAKTDIIRYFKTKTKLRRVIERLNIQRSMVATKPWWR